MSAANHTTRLLNEPEAAAYLGLAPRTLQSWRVRGRGPAYIKAGARVLYRVIDLERWVEAHRRDPEAQAHA